MKPSFLLLLTTWYSILCVTPVLFFILLLPLSGFKISEASECSQPLGLSSGEVLDWQLSSSSSYSSKWDEGCQTKFARLHQPNGRAWCAGRKAVGEWLLVDLGVQAKITGIITQGKCDDSEWVTKFQISYSDDAYRWYFVKDFYDNKKVFYANVNSHEPKLNHIEPSIDGRFLRVHVSEWHSHPSMRFEILGCQKCMEHISEGTQVKITASSFPIWRKKHSCQPYDAALKSQKGWCAKRKKKNEWLQFDLGPPHKVTGIITKGRGDGRKKQWVSSYTLTYSNDSVVWFTYKDGNHLDPKEFVGNMDKNTERRHYLNSPITARFVRINPLRWHKTIAMRASLLGCSHEGDCGKSFFRINKDSPCVENLAFKKNTWVNDERHQWTEWNKGQSSLAVDGFQDTQYDRCAVVHNYNSEEPIWMVDLGKNRDVTGIVLVTWQGKDQEHQTLYRDYVFGLEKLSVYIERKPRIDRLVEGIHHECNSVNRLNNALFREKIHLECPQTMRGRYVYVKGTGVANRWNPLFSLVLCEIFVY